jgi:hypothetical protein
MEGKRLVKLADGGRMVVKLAGEEGGGLLS